jgi:hypothetical protein
MDEAVAEVSSYFGFEADFVRYLLERLSELPRGGYYLFDYGPADEDRALDLAWVFGCLGLATALPASRYKKYDYVSKSELRIYLKYCRRRVILVSKEGYAEPFVPEIPEGDRDRTILVRIEQADVPAGLAALPNFDVEDQRGRVELLKYLAVVEEAQAK